MLPEVDATWILNKGCEWERVAAAYKMCDLVLKLEKVYQNSGGTKNHKDTYAWAGRAMRIGDAIHHAAMDSMQQKIRCHE